MTTTKTQQINRLRALLLPGDDADRELCRGAMSDAHLQLIARRRGRPRWHSVRLLDSLRPRVPARRGSGSATEGFGPRLGQLRQARGLTQEELCTLVGLSNRMIAYYERDDAEPPGRSSHRSRRPCG